MLTLVVMLGTSSGLFAGGVASDAGYAEASMFDGPEVGHMNKKMGN
ncbi:MAG: hypothetical protein ILP08_00740 [Lachnospiraceae bacterium]|jgi:hypothetical protein|nr:hypothetical protein [Lachnospiraceae bacterium]MBQ3902942.1 hypothetical protein [Lachnospiraceae bacterium]